MFAPEEHSNKLLTIFHQNLYKWMLSRGWQLVPKTSPEARERVVPPTGEHYLMRAPARLCARCPQLATCLLKGFIPDEEAVLTA